jgi:hypothetical protein
MKWLNESAGVLASSQQLEPVTENGVLVRGILLANGEFVRDSPGTAPPGRDIMHRPIPGQVAYADDAPEVIAWLRAREDTPEKQAARLMASPVVRGMIKGILAGLNINGPTEARVRAAIRAELEAAAEAPVGISGTSSPTARK